MTEPTPSRHERLELFLLSFTALFLELMVIRWAPAVVRVVNYYANLMLISSFLGLGIGALLASRRRDLLHLFPLALLGDVLVLRACRLATLPGSEAEVRFFAASPTAAAYLALLGVFVANTLLFVPLGQRVGRLFAALPNLSAYAWDLGGSLAGSVVFGVFALFRFSPVLGMAAVVASSLALAPRRDRVWQLAAGVLAVWLVADATDRRAVWSPYHYVTVHDESGRAVSEPVPDLATRLDPPRYVVRVNQDFYQLHATLDPRRYRAGAERARTMRSLAVQYMVPHLAAGRGRSGRVLVVGAGGGADVEAALLAGARHVDAVEIDPQIVRLSHRFNASRVYDDPRVTVTVDDARAFLRRCRSRYDVVAFGFLDSQGLSSSLANIRLDGFVYTSEGLRSAWQLVDEGGVLAISFFPSGRGWLAAKLVAMARLATGREPAVFSDGAKVIALVRRGEAPLPAAVESFQRIEPPRGPVEPATDDWPYLYLHARTLPSDYLIVIGSLLALSVLALWRVAPAGFGAPQLHFAALGAGFLLLETKSIVDCSLYFGATWFVTLVVVCGVLLMVLAANAVAMRSRLRPELAYGPLLASVLLLYVVPSQLVLGLPFGARLAWSLLAVPLPIFFAGLVFSRTFDGRQRDAPALLGANLIGAMAGGFGEYLGMAVGHRALTLLVALCYLTSLLFQRRSAR
jgi:hypothetical protein